MRAIRFTLPRKPAKLTTMKILIIRFSSFGDVLQSLSIAGQIGEAWPQAEIHWVTREEFIPLLQRHPHIARVWSLPRGAGIAQLWRLGRELKREKFTHIYDAHNNLRSHILSGVLNGFLSWRVWFGRRRFLRRSIFRFKRFMLFRFRRNLFPKPFAGQLALLEPLRRWGLSGVPPATPQLFLDANSETRARQMLPPDFGEFVALAPSAAFPLKRWPLEYWQELVRQVPDMRFVILGGPEDKFLETLAAVDPTRVLNLAGRLSLMESAQVVSHARALVANDTGLMHVAEQLGIPCLALMGPAPFGFPSRSRTLIYEIDLPCRPCSKHGQGPCVNPEFQKCLRDIRPANVAEGLRRIVRAPLATPLSY